VQTWKLKCNIISTKLNIKIISTELNADQHGSKCSVSELIVIDILWNQILFRHFTDIVFNLKHRTSPIYARMLIS